MDAVAETKRMTKEEFFKHMQSLVKEPAEVPSVVNGTQRLAQATFKGRTHEVVLSASLQYTIEYLVDGEVVFDYCQELDEFELEDTVERAKDTIDMFEERQEDEDEDEEEESEDEPEEEEEAEPEAAPKKAKKE